MIDSELAWKAVQTRDASANGSFYFGVLTTGIYCRPSCTSRQPLRKNVRFYETAEAAEQAGLRACLRCRPREARPTDPAAAMVQAACRYLETNSEKGPSLQELADRAKVSVFHFQRTFRRVAGVTPKQFLDSVRMQNLKQGLKGKDTVTGTIYAAGFGSSSRVYERSDTQLGMTPSQYRQGGKGVTITYAVAPSPLGLMMIGATERGLCFLQFGDTKAGLLKMLEKEYPLAVAEPMGEPGHADFGRWIESLNRYLEGTQSSLDLPLDLRASTFQLRVWNYLRSIPYGEVQSYSEVAAGIGSPTATRAVATACASNHVALLIPCHRVIRSNGELGGYRWGLERKRRLLDTERAGRVNARSELVQ
jgi:AraC family transcriptional regulator of adaptative response/methylated-DNA-[protein]-cysteine methyltransferase